MLVLTTGSHRTRSLVAAPNENRTPAGSLANGVLTLDLEAVNASWKPEGDRGGTLEIATFTEYGKQPTVPGPLIRARIGTRVNATVRNSFDKPLTVFGLGERGIRDSVVIPARGSQKVSFVLRNVGTFFYLGRTALDEFGGRTGAEQSLNGAIVVDAANAPARPKDRVLVISWYSTVDPKSPNGLGVTTMTMNGLSWPHTERMDYAQGDSIHWRVINVSDLDHPMHLHGFYFRLEARGDGIRDSILSSDEQRMAVTEIIGPFKTMGLSWKAERAGNWIFHCHYATHLSDLASLDMSHGKMKPDGAQHHASDAPHQMVGLVMGIRVAAKGPSVQLADAPRRIRMEMRERMNPSGDHPNYAFVLGGTPDERNPDAMPIPGSPIILERGRPVAITVMNRAKDHASVHWHGIELESYPDGVPGWSGAGATVLKSIMPGDSLTIGYTPPRAGSFMYHSHFNEAQQMGGGAYGPLIVLEPGERFDPATDKILFFGTEGMPKNVVFGPYPPFVLNGSKQPPPMNLSVGTRYRLRLFNLAGDIPTIVELKSGDKPVEWRPLAKDGYPVNAAQQRSRPATLLFEPGEIYDFEFTPTSAGELTLSFGPQPLPPGVTLPPIFAPPPPTIKVAVIVR
jgi:FtsP/CotA-like multicopper oxidase with cupredoxin domain